MIVGKISLCRATVVCTVLALGALAYAGQKGPATGITKLTPKATAGSPASPAGVDTGKGVPGGYGPGALSLQQLTRIARPNLAVFLPFDRDCVVPNNPTVPLDLGGGHAVFNRNSYIAPFGRLRDSQRFGILAFGAIQPMFIAVPPAAHTLALDMNQACTIAVWVFPERLGGLTGSANQTILCRGVTTLENAPSYCLALSPNGIPYFEGRVPANWPNPGPWVRQAARAVSLGRWQHICVVFNAGQVSFYIDGQPAGQLTAPAKALDAVRPSDCPLYIGARYAYDPTGDIRDPYFGYLDDLALWNRPLLPRDIAMLVSDNDSNGIADYWDFMITGRVPPPTGSKVTPTPTPVTPTPTPTPGPAFTGQTQATPVSPKKTPRYKSPTPPGVPQGVGPGALGPGGMESGPGGAIVAPTPTPTPRAKGFTSTARPTPLKKK
ncbi:MAG: LamG domain-containing protein [Candidatus Sumerlaeia bacterium]|nr:LamG domain-containing protein [Candidatus Sumerlaeia bacterium]